MSYESKLSQAEYWRLNRSDDTCVIEYTFYGSGWVRARICDLTPFEYAVCKHPKYALAMAENMLVMQRKRRE